MPASYPGGGRLGGDAARGSPAGHARAARSAGRVYMRRAATDGSAARTSALRVRNGSGRLLATAGLVELVAEQATDPNVADGDEQHPEESGAQHSAHDARADGMPRVGAGAGRYYHREHAEDECKGG